MGNQRISQIFSATTTTFLGALILYLAACGINATHPNILLISIDTLRADHLSCYGYHRQTSPFLDELAARGVRFSHSFVNTHGTPSSHATILSSLYQETHTVSHNTHHVPVKHAVPEALLLLPEILRDNDYLTLAVTGGGWVTAKMGFSQGFVEFVEDKDGIESATAKLTGLIRAYIQEGRPIFAFFHTYQVHSPYAPPEKYRTLYGEFESQFEPNAANLRAGAKNGLNLSAEDLALTQALYDGEIRYTDDTLRRMFLELEQIGFFENYIVVITSDHGEEFGEHGGLIHPSSLYDELLRVPLIWGGTVLPQGRVDARLVSSVDIAPTVIGAAGLEIPKQMAGRDLFGQFGHSDEGAIFSQYGGFRYAVRTRNWKLIQNMSPPSLELYDLRTDPKETRNVTRERPRQVKVLQERLAQWRARLAHSGGEGRQEVALSGAEIERLKSLGYLD